MELIYKYREHLKEYSVEEEEYYYYMPYTYVLRLQDYCKDVVDEPRPVEKWYNDLKDIEKRVVHRKSKDEEKLSSIW